MTTFVIGYDIAHPRRLARVYRTLLRYAAPIEHSIFIFDGTAEAVARCMREVLALIDVRQDDLRCYPLPVRGLQTRIGKVVLPVGIVWTGLPLVL